MSNTETPSIVADTKHEQCSTLCVDVCQAVNDNRHDVRFGILSRSLDGTAMSVFIVIGIFMVTVIGPRHS